MPPCSLQGGLIHGGGLYEMAVRASIVTFLCHLFIYFYTVPLSGKKNSILKFESRYEINNMVGIEVLFNRLFPSG